MGVGRGCRAHLVVPPLPLLLPPPRPPRLLLLLLLLRPPLLLLLPLFLQPKNNCLLCKLINAQQLCIKYWYSCIMKVHMYKENYINNIFFFTIQLFYFKLWAKCAICSAKFSVINWDICFLFSMLVRPIFFRCLACPYPAKLNHSRHTCIKFHVSWEFIEPSKDLPLAEFRAKYLWRQYDFTWK